MMRMLLIARRGNKAESGYVLNLSETCAKENSFQLITDYTVEKNVKSDVELLKERLPIVKQNTKCQEVYVGGGYYSKEVVQIAKENCVEVHFTDLNGRRLVKNFVFPIYNVNCKVGLCC